ncbi:MAG: hypothetical protein ACK5MY_13945 [Jhaorihella sp.]
MKPTFLTRIVDNFLGRGPAAVTVPALDGALKPNNRLEELEAGIAATSPDDLVLWERRLLWSDGAKLVSEQGVVAEFGSEITALAVAGDRLALATIADGLLLLDGEFKRVAPSWSRPVKNVTALAAGPKGGIWFCTGSELRAPDKWRRDLMELNRSGLIGRADPDTGEVRIVKRRLGYPSGIAVMPNGAILYSEAWASHLVEMAADGATSRVVLDEIPGYPGRIRPRESGGYWLCVFAPRNPLIELVLREPGYRNAMMREIPEDLWVAPGYSSGRSFHEPMQGGALKQMGILKPWAPTRSYGLVVELDASASPLRSFHSRAGGRRHGITSALEIDGMLWLAGRGSGEVLNMKPTPEGIMA